MSPATVTTASGATWQEIAADRQKHRDATIASIQPPIPEVPAQLPLNVFTIPRQLLTPEEIKITEMPVEDLAALIAERTLTTTEVIKAYLRKAGLAQKLVNCVTELLPQKALARAAFLDEHIATHKKPIGPLHGVPISVKEHVGMKGLDLNAGFVSWVGRVGEDDAYLLKILWSAGAVFYVRTTQPQSLMHLETSSNLYGVTVNPFNTTLTSGGSSGGEGSLVGIRGSPLGIGTDIGGSIRSPAANNGLYGFKPTSNRISTVGWSATMLGSEHIMACIGPLSTSLEGVKMLVKTAIAAKPWLADPGLVPMEWKDTSNLWREGKKLKIGVLWDDEIVKPHPPITKALVDVVQKLKEKDNVEIVDWKPYKHDLAWEVIANLYFCDGAAQEHAAINASGEPYRPLTEFILKENPYVQDHSITSMWTAQQKRDAYRAAYAAAWNSTATTAGPNGEPEGMVDVILCPVGPGVAPKINTARYWGYTSQWNTLDYPAVVFPVSKVIVDDYKQSETYEPRNPKDEYNWKLWEEYGAEGYKDAPVNLQLVGRRYEDEKVIRALEIIKEEAGLPFVKTI